MFELGFNLGVFTIVLINDPVLWLSCIGGEMVSVLASSAIDRRFEPRLDQTKDHEIGISCFFAKHAAFRRKSRLVGSESE